MLQVNQQNRIQGSSYAERQVPLIYLASSLEVALVEPKIRTVTACDGASVDSPASMIRGYLSDRHTQLMAGKF
eukprot:g24951.t1